jgi:hypothetical protein
MLPHTSYVGAGLLPVFGHRALMLVQGVFALGARSERLGDELASASVHPPLDRERPVGKGC